MSEWQTKLRGYSEKIESALRMHLPRSDSRLLEAGRYSLLTGGKRLRPLLAVVFYEALSGERAYRLIYHASASLEYLHTFSLIHDDLPGIDNDVLRRGQATCHVKFGEATAILAGDYLLNLAVENIGKLQTKSENKVALIKILTSCGRELLEGEMLDIIGESQPHSRELLEVTFLKKTGALFGACFALGGIMAGKILPRDYRWYQQLGNDLGLAFQIQDDVLGVMGDERKLGKSVGLDEEADKSTWVRAYGLEQAQIDYQKYYHRVRDGLSKLPDGEGKEFLGSLITYLQNRDH